MPQIEPHSSVVRAGPRWPAGDDASKNQIFDYLIRAGRRIATASTSTLVDPTVGSGLAGYAIALACIELTLGDARFHQDLVEIVERLPLSLAECRLPLSLMHGSCGVVWTVGLLERIGISSAIYDLSEFTGIVKRSLETCEEDYELLAGLSGIGLYALSAVGERATLLDAVHLSLLSTVECGDSECHWPTPPWIRLPTMLIKSADQPIVNTGMAHGIAGTIPFLMALSRATSESAASAAHAARGVARWLLRHLRINNTGLLTLGHFVHGNQHYPSTGRLAWCYGDVGVYWALCRARSTLSNQECELISEYGESVFRRLDEGVISSDHDLTLCHGASGNLLVLLALEHPTESGPIDLTARYYKRVLTAVLEQERRYGGLLYLNSEDGSSWTQRRSLGYLQGEAGVVVALCSVFDRTLLACAEPLLGPIDNAIVS
jgi:hypothetical protein